MHLRLAFQHRADRGGQAAQATQLALVRKQLGAVGQRAVHEQVGNFLELGFLGEVEDVVTAIMEVVASASDRAQRGVAGRDA